MLWPLIDTTGKTENSNNIYGVFCAVFTDQGFLVTPLLPPPHSITFFMLMKGDLIILKQSFFKKKLYDDFIET